MTPSELATELPEPLLRLPSFVMVQLVREARRIAGSLGDDGIRLPHVAVLSCLAEFGPASQKDISQRLRIDASDLVALLDDLEEAGLASRRRDPKDRRRYAVTLTDAGRDALRRRMSMAERLNDKLFEPLSGSERAELHRLLLRVYAFHDPGRLPADYR